MNQIILNVFVDELEKLAGLPRAVRKGGGGALGRALRGASLGGELAARDIADLKRLSLQKSPVSHILARDAAREASDMVNTGQAFKRLSTEYLPK